MKAKDTTRSANNVSGQLAEECAARFLGKRGLTVLTRNYRCRSGEIDLVCRDGDALVFVEVRLRRNTAYGGAGGSITPAKQRRIVMAAQHYLAVHDQASRDCRFDCLLLAGSDETSIEWIRDAFAAD